jgi:hypothetical protein
LHFQAKQSVQVVLSKRDGEFLHQLHLLLPAFAVALEVGVENPGKLFVDRRDTSFAKLLGRSQVLVLG